MDLEKKLTRLQRTLQYARTHSRFYAALPETQPQTLADYAAFPMLTADDLLLHGAELLCCPPSRVRRIVSLETSGTSGTRKRIFFTERDLEATVDFFHHGMDAVCAGTNRVGILMPGTNPDGLCDLLSRGIRRFGGVPLYYGPIRDADDCARWCLENRIETLVGIPSQVRRLALLHPELPVQNALLSSDYVSPALVETISRRWNARALNHYGMTESGYGLAVQTEPGGPMRLRQDALLETLPDGELVLTALDREAMPMLRYRTGDLGRLDPDGTLAAVYGRKKDRSAVYSLAALDDLLYGDDAVLDYRAALSGSTLTVEILGVVTFSREALAQLGCTVRFVEDMPFCSGKRTLIPTNEQSSALWQKRRTQLWKNASAD